MKHFTQLCTLLMLSACMLTGCKDTLEINDLDGTVEADVALALPLGTLDIRLGDILEIENKTTQLIVDKYGLLHLCDTFDIDRNFRTVNIDSYPAKASEEFNVRSGFGVAEIWPGDHYEVEYPIEIGFENLNLAGGDERFDSISVINAYYTSTVELSNDLISQGFKWEWVKRVDVILKEGFTRPQGTTLTIYDQSKHTVANWGDDIDIRIDNFTLHFIKDLSQKPGPDNILQTARLGIKFYVTIPWDIATNIQVNDALSSIKYTLELKMLDFDAVWGYAEPSNQMRDKGEIKLTDHWDIWKMLGDANLPLAQPSCDMSITTNVSGNFMLDGELFGYSLDDPENITWTEFGENKDHHVYKPLDLYSMVYEVGHETVGEAFTRHIIFDYTDKGGHIERLLQSKPDILGYQFNVQMDDKENHPQMRMAPDNHFKMKAAFDIPFIMDSLLYFSYTDTLPEINLSEYALDSLLDGALANESIDKAELNLFLDLQNQLPMGATIRFRFLDKDYKEVLVDGEPLKFAKLGEEDKPLDSLRLAAPKMKAGGTPFNVYYVADPDQFADPATHTMATIFIGKEHLNEFATVRHIALKVSLDNKLAPGITTYPVGITADASIFIKLSVTARVNGKIDIMTLLNSNKK